jgi:hypothetical protein
MQSGRTASATCPCIGGVPRERVGRRTSDQRERSPYPPAARHPVRFRREPWRAPLVPVRIHRARMTATVAAPRRGSGVEPRAAGLACGVPWVRARCQCARARHMSGYARRSRMTRARGGPWQQGMPSAALAVSAVAIRIPSVAGGSAPGDLGGPCPPGWSTPCLSPRAHVWRARRHAVRGAMPCFPRAPGPPSAPALWPVSGRPEVRLHSPGQRGPQPPHAPPPGGLAGGAGRQTPATRARGGGPPHAHRRLGCGRARSLSRFDGQADAQDPWRGTPPLDGSPGSWPACSPGAPRRHRPALV